MDKGKRVMQHNEDGQSPPKKRQATMETSSQNNELLNNVHNHYKALMAMQDKQIAAREDAMNARVKYERRNAKLRLLQKQISLEDFNMEREWNKRKTKEEQAFEEWSKIEIPHVGYEKMGCNLKGFGSSSS